MSKCKKILEGLKLFAWSPEDSRLGYEIIELTYIVSLIYISTILYHELTYHIKVVQSSKHKWRCTILQERWELIKWTDL